MKKTVIEIDESWVKRINSPLGKLAQALTGVSVSFAPLFLYFYAKGMQPLGPAWIGIPVCAFSILLAGFFNGKLSQYVIAQLYAKKGLES